MNSIDQSFQESISCYREMLDLYRRIQAAVTAGEPAAGLHERIEKMKLIEEEAREHDALIWKKAGEAGEMPTDNPLFYEWQDLLSRVRSENHAMQRRLRAAMAVIKDECRRIREGKQGISGYRSGRDQAGRRINIPSA